MWNRDKKEWGEGAHKKPIYVKLCFGDQFWPISGGGKKRRGKGEEEESREI